MPHQRLETASTGELPQLDGAIPARASEPTAIGGKRQAMHHVGMPGERLPEPSRSALLPLPQPDRAREVTTAEQAAIRAPGQCEDRTGMGLVLHRRAERGLPQPDD